MNIIRNKNKGEKRREILLSNSILSFLPYCISFLLAILAKATGLTTMSYEKILLIAVTISFLVLIFIFIISIKKTIGILSSQIIGIIQLFIWLLFFGLMIFFIGKIRYTGLIVISMALIFQITTFTVMQSVIFTLLTSTVYIISSYFNIIFIDPTNSLWLEIFHVICFIPTGIIIIIVTNHFSKQRYELKKAKRTSENSLKKIMNELQLAKKIQEDIIPQKTEENFISALYKPMEEVGGDFFDFIRFRHSDKIGIFLSDVSGHGVAAAFITSMIKTIILQAGLKKENPSELLHYINNMLHGRTARNFVTAFYGIYDPSSRSLLYSNAGHYQPYTIADKVTQLPETRNLALGIFPNSTLNSKNKNYQNYEEKLIPRSKLLFFTDGLIESMPLDGGDYFQNSNMFEIFLKNKHLSCNEFVSNLHKELVTFRQSETFNDDICVVCLDID